MNEEYLWNKTGSDSEIEDLEDLFAPLRYRPTPAPALRADKAAGFGWLTNWLTPAAGLLTAATLLFAIGLGWLIANQDGGETNQAAVVTPPAVRNDKPQTVENGPAPRVPETLAAEQIKPTTALHFPKAHRARLVPAVAKSRKVKAKNNGITKEEQQAYEQVMLALSIASDKLKIVSEAANGSDE